MATVRNFEFQFFKKKVLLVKGRERAPGTQWIGGWVGPTSGLDAVLKRKIPITCRESNSRTPIVQFTGSKATGA
jgi:hypothetical protein